MSDDKKNKVGFLSSKYRSPNGMTSADSQILSETIATELGWYCKAVEGHEPSKDAMSQNNSYLAHISKKAVNTPAEFPADLDLFTRVTKSRASGDYKYCSKCKRDCYMCRHDPSFSSPDPKETYIVPAATNQLYGWQPDTLKLVKPKLASVRDADDGVASPVKLSPTGRATIVIGAKAAPPRASPQSAKK